MRLGKIGFLNVLPVYYPLERGIIAHEFELVSGSPAHLNELMAAGRLDISSVSSIEVAYRPENYFVLPDLSISSHGEVKSVLLMCRVPFAELGGEPILVTRQSHTSIALLHLICRCVLKMRDYRFVSGSVRRVLDSGERPRAFLAIGDEALKYAQLDDYPYRMDLGEAWTRWTGLPFVFGLWAVRRQCVASGAQRVRKAHESLMAAKNWGREHCATICDEAHRLSGFDPALMKSYYQSLSYDLGEREQKGLRHFFRLLYQTNTIPWIPQIGFLTAFEQVA